MHIDGGVCNNLVPFDYQYFERFGWRSSLRPHHEPFALRDTFTGKAVDFVEERFEARLVGDSQQQASMLAEYSIQTGRTFNQDMIPRCGCKRGWLDWFIGGPQ